MNPTSSKLCKGNTGSLLSNENLSWAMLKKIRDIQDKLALRFSGWRYVATRKIKSFTKVWQGLKFVKSEKVLSSLSAF